MGLIPALSVTKEKPILTCSGPVPWRKAPPSILLFHESTETTAGIDLSAEYIIDNNLAASHERELWGLSNSAFGTAAMQFYNALWEQAAAQGITVMISTGDSGSAGCDQNSGTGGATRACSKWHCVDAVQCGGRRYRFQRLQQPANLLGFANDPTTQESALELHTGDDMERHLHQQHCSPARFSTNAETNCNNAS